MTGFLLKKPLKSSSVNLKKQIEEYERVEQEKMKERHIANKKFLERMRQDESMQQFDG